jgi:hypothetical protein
LKAVVGSQGFPMQNGVISRQIFCILVWYILLFFSSNHARISLPRSNEIAEVPKKYWNPPTYYKFRRNRHQRSETLEPGKSIST